MKNHTQITPWPLLLSLTLLLHACSTPFGQKEVYEVVDRTRPADSPWKYTPTPNLSLTATAATRQSAIATYTYYESFDENTYEWRVGAEDNAYWQGSISIIDSAYTWQIAGVNELFIAWSDFKQQKDLVDFDIALTARRVTGEPHLACFGLMFRKSPDGLDAGSYILSVCDNGYYKLLYYDAQNGWDVLQDWTQTEAIQKDNWNLLEISARGDRFSISINHLPVHTFSDSRLPSGMVSILVDYYSESPGLIEFDLFALQPQ